MKMIVCVFLLSAACFGQMSNQGTMKKAEKLTEAESAKLEVARAEVAKAEAKLRAVQAEIAVAHKFTAEHWMEWESWYEFDGEFIVQRGRSFMGSTIVLDGGK